MSHPHTQLKPCWLALALALTFQVSSAQADGNKKSHRIKETSFIDATEHVSVQTNILTSLAELLPERRNAGAAFVSELYDANFTVTSEGTQVKVTFVNEGAGFRNSLGYFTYHLLADSSVQIIDRQIIFPNASRIGSGGLLNVGDSSWLRDAAGQIRAFHSGDQIGFFLVANGWGRGVVQNWNPTTSTYPSTDALANGNIASGVYTSIKKLNREHGAGHDEAAQHVAMIRMHGTGVSTDMLQGNDFYVIGFEDLNRIAGSDEDFNDLLFLTEATPPNGITADVLPYDPNNPDPDGDGITGMNDQFPNDPTRAYTTRTPATGEFALAMEDRYPYLGDADFNDAVVMYHIEQIYDANNALKDVIGTFNFVSRGAGLDSRFGLHLPQLPANATGTVEIERFLSDAAATHSLSSISLQQFNSSYQQRLVLFPSAKQAMPPVAGKQFTNTDSSTVEQRAASARFHLLFTSAVASGIGTVPFDPYFEVLQFNGDRIDIHLPGKDGFADRPASLPVETGPTAFLDDQGTPWLLNVTRSWQWPLEKVPLHASYLRFNNWVASHGNQDNNWYDFPDQANTAMPLFQYLTPRSWTVKRP